MNHFQCETCGKKDALVFHCNYCGGYFCAEHHLPENHNCANKPRSTAYIKPPETKPNEPLPKIGKPIPYRSTYSHPKQSKPSFWKYALFKLLRVVGICSALIGAFGGLIALGNHLTDGIILAAFLFIGGILLSWYAGFKTRTITIERGIRDAGSGKTSPTRTKRRNKLILLGICIIITVLLLFVFSSLSALPKTVTGKLYLQSTASDWGDENFAMSKNLLNGEQKSNDMWHHPNNFISPPLKQNFKITELTFQLYHNIVPPTQSSIYGEYGFLVECFLIDVNGEVQTISTKSISSVENSRSTSYTISFYPNSVQFLQNERLYVKIKVSTGAAWDWQWSDANYPSHITYKGVPQYEEIPIF